MFRVVSAVAALWRDKARASWPAGSCTVSVQDPGGGTPSELAAGTAALRRMGRAAGQPSGLLDYWITGFVDVWIGGGGVAGANAGNRRWQMDDGKWPKDRDGGVRQD